MLIRKHKVSNVASQARKISGRKQEILTLARN